MAIPKSRLTIAALALAVAAGLSHGASAQSSIGDCEKIQAADAYNQCLAKFGPESKVKSLEPEKPSDFKSSSAEAAATSPAKGHGHARHATRRRGGHAKATGSRKRMSFSVGHRRHH